MNEVNVGKRFDSSTGLTCLSCQLVFADPLIQKAHYQEDWHRYNVKRRIADLPPLTKDSFEAKAREYARVATGQSAAGTDTELYCSNCRKSFQSLGAYENHQRSKRHLENVAAADQAKMENKIDAKNAKEPKVVEEIQRVDQHQIKSTNDDVVDFPMDIKMGNDEDGDDSSEGWETVDGSDMEYDETEAIPPLNCIFCAKSSPFVNIDAQMEHMSLAHGFRLPDHQFCSDLNGLLTYLGQKIGCGKTCVCCGRRFRDLSSCQKHMRDKNHCCFSLESNKRGECDQLVEYIDYYDYSALSDEEEGTGDDSPVELFDEGAWLVLPSGARIGHRSLARYFRQSLRPVNDEMTGASIQGSRGKLAAIHGKILSVTGVNNGMVRAYGSLKPGGGLARGVSGIQHVSNNTQMVQQVVRRRAKDIAFMRRAIQKMQLRQGQTNARLFKSRGRDDQQ